MSHTNVHHCPIRQAIAATRRGGALTAQGVCAGWINAFLFGDVFEKGISLEDGQTHTQNCTPQLLERIARGDMHPGPIITHTLALADAARGYEIVEKKQEDCRKVVLTTG